MKTLEERIAEATALRTMMPTVRRMSMFGENHHDAITAQAQVLDENLSDDDIDGLVNDDDLPDNVETAMRDARQWLDEGKVGCGKIGDGETFATLTESWAELVVK